MELNNRVAIITGGANGIGRATALLFARSGSIVSIWDMSQDIGEALAAEINQKGGKAAFHKVNVTSQDEVNLAVEATLSEFGHIDILINNAGITRDAQLVKVKDGEVTGKMAEADFDAVIAVNLKGVFNCTQAVAPHMIAQGYGRIINASSVVGLYSNFGQTNYVASKATIALLAGPLETDREFAGTTTADDGSWSISAPAGGPYWVHIRTFGSWWGYSYQTPFTLSEGEQVSRIWLVLGPR